MFTIRGLLPHPLFFFISQVPLAHSLGNTLCTTIDSLEFNFMPIGTLGMGNACRRTIVRERPTLYILYLSMNDERKRPTMDPKHTNVSLTIMKNTPIVLRDLPRQYYIDAEINIKIYRSTHPAVYTLRVFGSSTEQHTI